MAPLQIASIWSGYKPASFNDNITTSDIQTHVCSYVSYFFRIFSEEKELDMPHLIADVMFTLKLYQTYKT